MKGGENYYHTPGQCDMLYWALLDAGIGPDIWDYRDMEDGE